MKRTFAIDVDNCEKCGSRMWLRAPLSLRAATMSRLRLQAPGYNFRVSPDQKHVHARNDQPLDRVHLEG